MTNKKIKIFRDYIETQNAPLVAAKNKVRRQYVYFVIQEIRKGKSGSNKAKIKLNLLWESRFKIWHEAIPKDQKRNSTDELRKLIVEMDKAGFPKKQIGKLVDRDPATIRFYCQVKGGDK